MHLPRPTLLTFFLATILFAFGCDRLTAEEKPNREVVHFSKLVPLLPNAPEGWNCEEPNGSTTDMGSVKMTNVDRSFANESQGATVHISIIDFNQNQEYAETFTSSWNASFETTEGHSKMLTIEGQPAFENFQKEGKQTSLTFIVAKRFMVQLEANGMEPERAREWASKIDLKKLAELAQ